MVKSIIETIKENNEIISLNNCAITVLKQRNKEFKLNSAETTKEQFSILLEIIKHYSKTINIFELDNYLYFSVEKINYYADYINKISNYAYYNNNIETLNKIDFDLLVCDYDLRNDLLIEIA